MVDEVKKAVRSDGGSDEQWEMQGSENGDRREGDGNNRLPEERVA
ncbi:MAG: hypothetical protein P0120_16410 [Nitrospira sp.]|nr:hypothetical protein [Nitrospira sp.]